jgi:hypothetical protein
VRRRRIAGAGALAVLLLFVVLVWPVGLVVGGDDNKKSNNATNASAQKVQLIGQLLLKPVDGGQGAGIAVVAQRGNTKQLIVQARLTPNKTREAYEVWLYNSPTDAKSLGAQVTDKQGTFQGAGPLPADYKKFKYIDVSREKVDTNKAHSGISVLRGAIADIKAVPKNAAGGATGTSTTPAPTPTTTTP